MPAALIFRKVVRAGGCSQDAICSNGDADASNAPFDVTSATTVGIYKLSDADANALRASSVLNNLCVQPWYGGNSSWGRIELGKSYHKRECGFITTEMPLKSGPCAFSTTSHDTTSYDSRSTHNGISRWYGAGASTFGYIFPSIHVGYHSVGPDWGMQGHGSSTPVNYCTLYDHRGCGQDVWFDIWAL